MVVVVFYFLLVLLKKKEFVNGASEPVKRGTKDRGGLEGKQTFPSTFSSFL